MTTSTDLSHDANNEGPLTREKLERELGKFGKAFGQGQNSRPSAALLCVDAAHRLGNVGPNDAAALYERFSKAAAAAQEIEYSASSSAKVQVSKLKRFLMLGALKTIDGVVVMNRATDLIESLSRRAENPMRGSAYDNMVLIARRQLESPTKEMSTTEIEDILTAEQPEKTELDKVIDAYKKVYNVADKLAEAGIDNDAALRAVDELAAQITDMDGTVPAMTKEARQIAKAQEVLSKHGLPTAMVIQQVAEEGEQAQQAA